MMPEVGKTYTDYSGNTRLVTSVTDTYVFYLKNGRKDFENPCPIRTFITVYMTDKKPLDQAFKQLDKQLCSHRNIREDRYFSAMVYKTCKDCGQALN